jgi:LacI family transcriptional regulator
VVEVHALAEGFSTQVASTWRSPQREREQLQRMTREHVRGLLLAPTMGNHDYFQAVLGNVPAVLVDRGWAGSGLDMVGVHDRAATRTAIAQLLSLGHRRIAFLGDISELSTIKNREQGYLDALLGAGMAVSPELLKAELSTEDPGGTAVAELLDLPEPPTAIFCSNARTSLGAVRCLHRRGRADVAMISFGDFDLADTLVPGVTIVAHDPEKIAAAAFDRLLSRIRGKELDPVELLLPVSLVARGSGELPGPYGAQADLGRDRQHTHN